MKTKANRMISKIMLSYTLTFIMIELVNSSTMVVDGIIVSRGLGATALAATGLADPSYHIMSILSGIFAVGMQSLCSAAMGSGDRKKIRDVFSCGSAVIALIAVVMTVLGFACLHPLCVIFGADGSDPELYSGLYRYLKGWFTGIPGFIGFMTVSPIVTLDGNKKCVTLATVVQCAVNVVGDLLSVSVFNAGTYGIGFSTGLSFNISFVILLTNFFRKRSSFRCAPGRIRMKTVTDMTRIGMPQLTKYLCKMASPLLVNRIIIGIGGSTAMAAMSVKHSINGFCLIAGAGIAESVNLMSQVFYGEKDREALYSMADSALRLDFLLCNVLALILFCASRLIAGIYLPAGTEVYAFSVLMLRCLALSLCLNGINSAVLSYLQGIRRILPAHMQTASHRLVFLVLASWILGKWLGVKGLFYAIPVSELLVLVNYIAAALLSGRSRDRQEALLLIPDDFSINREDSLSVTVTSVDEVIGISEQVYDYCKAHGVEHRRAYYSSLCIEELAGNVVEHGFTKDNKTHSCDIRVMMEDGDIVLRIRDDCRYFNIKERYEAMSSADTTANVGIRLVYGIAKDVSYVHLLDTNTLIIRV